MSLYRKIFYQSWQIVWRRKYLWFFGLFAAMLTGSSAEMDVFSRVVGSDEVVTPWQMIVDTVSSLPQTIVNIGTLAQTDPYSLTMALITLSVLGILALFMLWLAITSQAALVNNIALEADGRDNNMKIAVTAGLSNFWPVFGYNILNKLVVVVCSALISVPVILGLVDTGSGVGVFSYFLLFIILIPIALIISLMLKYAIGYHIIKRRRFWRSIAEGWHLFRDNWIISTEMVASLFALSFIFALSVVFVLLILMVPFAFVAFVSYYITSSVWFVIIIGGLAVILAFVAIVLAGSIFFAFQTAAWTCLFVELIGQGGKAKIVRIVENMMK